MVPLAPSIEPRISPRISTNAAIPQYSRRAILAVTAAAALPMAALAWIVAPLVADTMTGPLPLTRALIICLTGGLIWQFVLVVALVWREQRTLRWSVVREVLWLRAPRNPRSGRNGGKVWWALVPLMVAYAAEQFVPVVPHPANRDFGALLDSHAGQAFLHGAWGWYALILVMLLFNTVLGEELLFRGFLLPRMNGAYGRRDWVANGILFAAYHLAIPWAIPATLLDIWIFAYPAKRYRSAWIGIAVHSTQSVFFSVLLFGLVI